MAVLMCDVSPAAVGAIDGDFAEGTEPTTDGLEFRRAILTLSNAAANQQLGCENDPAGKHHKERDSSAVIMEIANL